MEIELNQYLSRLEEYKFVNKGFTIMHNVNIYLEIYNKSLRLIIKIYFLFFQKLNAMVKLIF